MVHVLRMTHCNLRDDLVAARRQFTNIVAVLVPLVCLAIGIIEAYELLDLRNVVASPAIAACCSSSAGLRLRNRRHSQIAAASTGRLAPQPGSGQFRRRPPRPRPAGKADGRRRLSEFRPDHRRTREPHEHFPNIACAA
jgi:hypothetical protein